MILDDAAILSDKLQEYLIGSGIEWNCLDEATHDAAESEWRSIYGIAFKGRSRLRKGAKAENECRQQSCMHFLIVPFSSNVEGISMDVLNQSIPAYECRGTLVPLGGFRDAEFFVSPPDFEWTMVHTHEDHALGGPYFIRRDWVT